MGGGASRRAGSDGGGQSGGGGGGVQCGGEGCRCMHVLPAGRGRFGRLRRPLIRDDDMDKAQDRIDALSEKDTDAAQEQMETLDEPIEKMDAVRRIQARSRGNAVRSPRAPRSIDSMLADGSFSRDTPGAGRGSCVLDMCCVREQRWRSEFWRVYCVSFDMAG